VPVVRVRFIACGGFVSRAILWMTNSLWSHVEFGTPEGMWLGAHAGSGIQERPADYCKPRLERVYEIPCTDEQLEELLRWARSQIGVEYNYRDIVGLMVKNRTLNSPKRFICSQFCTQGLLRVFGAKRVLNVMSRYAYLVTPEMLHLSPLFVGRLKQG
jgi:hypothetical protein